MSGAATLSGSGTHTRSRVLATAIAASTGSVHAQKTTLKVDASAPGKPISPDLIGVFFEDLNYAADGGLYAELIQNRSFEYSPTEQSSWNPLSFWDLQKRARRRWHDRACPRCARSMRTIRTTPF